MTKQKYNIIISGGGTGGHIFPAISIANAIRKKHPEANILFVGAKGKMEMEKVPAAGYEIVGLPIAGFQRKVSFKNITLVFKLINSLLKARRIVKKFKPDVAVGVGGYASGPLLRIANQMGVPTLLQEQNSYAGVTNRLLAKKAETICVAYEGMEKYFPKNKSILTGNPIRQELFSKKTDISEAKQYFNIPDKKKVILVLGGSLGARSINNAIKSNLADFKNEAVFLIWQTGKYYFEEMKAAMVSSGLENVYVTAFINQMEHAFAVADVIVSRAGAGTISELCLVGKPVILVPSPNVAEDHQTKNAQALEHKNAAVMVKDAEALEKLTNTALELIFNEDKKAELSRNIKTLGKPNASDDIAVEVIKLIEKE
jgi:UDP-N-acetylglucosamine--N-acetylmuramyl-(pentapeptide) pyrophosphoryl-undecaprenol N-acetylglucosamine transferase